VFKVLNDSDQGQLSPEQLKQYKRKEKLYGQRRKTGKRKKSNELEHSSSLIRALKCDTPTVANAVLSPHSSGLKLAKTNSVTRLSKFSKSSTLILLKLTRELSDQSSDISEIEEEMHEAADLSSIE